MSALLREALTTARLLPGGGGRDIHYEPLWQMPSWQKIHWMIQNGAMLIQFQSFSSCFGKNDTAKRAVFTQPFKFFLISIHTCPVYFQAIISSAVPQGGDHLKPDVPISEKPYLTLDEAAAYFGIGVNKLRCLTDTKACEKYVLWVGNKRLIKRVPFQAYLDGRYSV